jgi:hypothetical protein
VASCSIRKDPRFPLPGVLRVWLSSIRIVVVILVLPVMGFVLRRRLLLRREARLLLERSVAEAQAAVRQREIIGEMELQFAERQS